MMQTIEVEGPVVLRPIDTRDFTLGTLTEGHCGECEREFMAADLTAGQTMARRHWAIVHPEYETIRT